VARRQKRDATPSTDAGIGLITKPGHISGILVPGTNAGYNSSRAAGTLRHEPLKLEVRFDASKKHS
jgi:hypothetical protein